MTRHLRSLLDLNPEETSRLLDLAAKVKTSPGDYASALAGKSIASLQDYSDALRGAKSGESVTIVVLREAERLSLTITPETRKQ